MTTTESSAGKALGKSIGSEELTNLVATVGDLGLQAAETAVSNVPVLNLLVGMFRAGRDARKEIEFRQVLRFLTAVAQTPAQKRAAFVTRLHDAGKLEDFGENILLLLSRLDHTQKPSLVGKVLAAHIEGHIEYDKAMRLAAIINRCYVQDLEYLREFQPGVQGDGEDVAAMLFSAGLLANGGINGGGSWDAGAVGGGTIYELNEYGRLLIQHAL